MIEKPRDVLQAVDAKVVRHAKSLIRTARYAALGTLDPETGAPSVSRVALATFPGGEPGFFISALAAHQRNLVHDSRSSLLVGEIGKGDPLAHPRMTLIGKAVCLDDGPELENFRSRYRSKNSKSKLYQDLPDFTYWRFVTEKVSFNAGFGRAYAPDPQNLRTECPDVESWWATENAVIEKISSALNNEIQKAAESAGGSGIGWRLACADPEGIDLVRGDDGLRLWFEPPANSPDDVTQRVLALVQSGSE